MPRRRKRDLVGPLFYCYCKKEAEKVLENNEELREEGKRPPAWKIWLTTVKGKQSSKTKDLEKQFSKWQYQIGINGRRY